MNFTSEKISLLNRFYLFFILITNLHRFENYEEEYKKIKKGEDPSDVYLVRRAFYLSFAMIIFIVIIGTIIGWGLSLRFGNPKEMERNILQILGATFILHGTLFLRGWEIQSFQGDTLSEQMNRWIYRFQISFGTLIIVVILSWSYF